jgi:hypothetical protein
MTAMTRASSTLANECADGIKRITPDGAPDAVIKQIWKLCEIGGSFDFEFEQRDLRSGLDDFYKDSQNTSLLIDIALQRVGDILRSKRPPVGGIGGR